MKTLSPVFFIVFQLVFLLLADSALANVNLSINPTDGSASLRFERFTSNLDNKKGLRIRVVSTNGQKYQIFQRVLEPLVNEKGETLDLQAIELASVYNSNATGTLYVDQVNRLSYSEQLIYTSGAGGEGDSFIIDYTIRPDQLTSSGNFIGKLVFTVRVMGEATQDQVVMDVQVDSAGAWDVSVKGGKSPDRVVIKDSDTSEKTADFIRVDFSGNNGQEVRIYQEVEALPQSTAARELPSDLIWFSMMADNQQDIRLPEPSNLLPARKLIYSGQKKEDHIMVYFWLDADKVTAQEADSYIGKLRYVIETDSGREEFVMNLECAIQPIFSILVNTPPGGVSFTNVLPTKPPEEKEVMVTVQTNLHKPYQVMQIMSAPMTNESGKEMGKEHLTLKVDIPEGQKGQTNFNDFATLETGEYPVFSSDGQGSPATFKVIYRLHVDAQSNSGNFLAPIKFSLNQN